KLRSDGVLVVAEPSLSKPQEVRPLLHSRNVLLVLPKRFGRRSGDRPEWVDRTMVVPVTRPAEVLKLANVKPDVVRVESPVAWKVNELGVAPKIAGSVQLITATELRPIVGTHDGMLVGELRTNTRRLWVLADPDVLANHGIGGDDNAAFALALINGLRGRNGN